MDLKGKKVVFFGDSITEGLAASAPEHIYHAILKEKLGLKEAVNCGIGGTRIARQRGVSKYVDWDRDFNSRTADLPDADAVIVFGGTNDFGHGDAPLGSPADETVYTFYGACRTLFRTLTKKYACVVVLTPLHRTSESSPSGDGRKEEPGALLSDYVAALKTMAEGLPVIDLWKRRELDPNTPEGALLFADGLHPNDAGHALLAQILAEELLAL